MVRVRVRVLVRVTVRVRVRVRVRVMTYLFGVGNMSSKVLLVSFSFVCGPKCS